MIRTGGPSAPGDAKVAIVASNKKLNGKRFQVSGPGPGIGGKLRPAKGFSGPWKHAYAADISAASEPGAYRVSAGGARSKQWFVLGEGSRGALQTMLGYFAANRDGNETSPIHGPAHLNDAVLPDGTRIDLQGGWMDAGDMIHFTQTTGFAATALQLAAILDPADAAALNSEADVGIRWLVAAHPEPGLFIAQVGDARDHDLGFRDPAEDDASSEPGIGQRIAYPGTGGDVAGKATAALALAAMRTSGAQRAALTQQARDWYAAGEAAGGPLRDLPEIAGDFYYTDSHEDDMAAGAMMLFRLTGDPQFVADAVDYLQGVLEPDRVRRLRHGLASRRPTSAARSARRRSTMQRAAISAARRWPRPPPTPARSLARRRSARRAVLLGHDCGDRQLRHGRGVRGARRTLRRRAPEPPPAAATTCSAATRGARASSPASARTRRRSSTTGRASSATACRPARSSADRRRSSMLTEQGFGKGKTALAKFSRRRRPTRTAARIT